MRYSFAEVHFRHKTIRYVKAGKGTDYQQLLALRRVIQQANPTRLVIIMHGDLHIGGETTQENEDLLMDYFQSDEFIAEQLIWTKATYLG